MTDDVHAFEDDIMIKEELKGRETIFSAYADGELINRYPPHRAANAMVARQLAGIVLSASTLEKDLLDIATWFSATHVDYECEIVVHRYRHQRRHKAISHLLTFSEPERRPQIKITVAEASMALG